jgi:hypothetical protein
MKAATTYYGVLIQIDPHTGYGPLVGWDECFSRRSEAEECCQRAVRKFHNAKVVGMTKVDAIKNGWIDA